MLNDSNTCTQRRLMHNSCWLIKMKLEFVYLAATIFKLVLLIQYHGGQSSPLQHSEFASEYNRLSNNSNQQPCPHWTYRTHQNSNCTCGNNINGVISCTNDKSPVYVLSCHCMSLNRWGEAVEGQCPYLCTNNFHTVVKDTNDLRNGRICNKKIPQNRHGQLCGRCEEGHAPAAYSYSFICTNCTSYKNNWMRYVAIAYVPITILFLVVLFFRWSVMSPALNANIFFCQIVSCPAVMSLLSVFVYFSEKTPVDPELNMKLAIRALSILYGVWNLDFFHLTFEPFCLHPDMNTLSVIALDYGVAIYPIILIGITLILVKFHDSVPPIRKLWKPVTHVLHYCDRKWKVSNFLIETFGTFFLLSYVKVINTSFALLMPVWTRNVTGQTNGTYLYYNGSMEYLGPEHRPFFILAVLMFTAFNIIPFLLFCLYPCRCFQSCLNCCRLNSQVLRTFMDAFQGCYKFEPYDCRYWAAFYLFLRIAVLIIFAFTQTAYFVVVTGIFMIPVACLTAIVRPYKNNVYNIIDVVLFLVFSQLCLTLALVTLSTFDTRYFVFAAILAAMSLLCPPMYAVVCLVRKVLKMSCVLHLRRYIYVNAFKKQSTDTTINEESLLLYRGRNLENCS